jgi:hypothetical protein
MTSYVTLPAYPVFKAAEAMCKQLQALHECNQSKLRRKLSRPARLFFVGPKIALDKRRVEALVKSKRNNAACWAGKHDQFLRAFQLMGLCTAALNARNPGIYVSADDLEAIREFYFDRAFMSTVVADDDALERAGLAI